MTATGRRPLRFAKAAVATTTATILLVGPPLFLWWVSDRRFIPDLGPGGFTDLWATLRAGQVPDKGVLLLCVALGWLIWCYLAAVFLHEFIAVWSDRAAGVQVRDLSGARWLMSKLAGWILAGNTVVASAFVVTPDFTLPSDEIALVVDRDGVGEGPAPAAAEAGREAAFDPEAFFDFTGEEPTADPISELDRSAIPVNYESGIIEGDNLWNIAEALTGDGMHYHDIWAATDLGALVPEVDPHNPDLIFPGNVVQVPTRLMSDEMIERLFGEQPRLDAIEETPAEEPPDPAPEEVPELAPVEQKPTPASTPVARATAAEGQGGLNSVVVAAGAGLLGVAASAVILAGLVRRRRRRVAAAPGNRRPNRADRRAIDAENRLKARLGHQIWAPDELAAAWNSLHPEDPGASQPWCVRWNADLNVLEAAWTTDHLRPPEAGRAPTVPADDSPWTLVTKEDRTGAKKEIWTIAERDVPSRPQVDAVPAMVGCADGRGDRPSDDGFWMNLEAAGTVAVETTGREAVDPSGVVRSFLLQMQANAPVELYLLNTDLGLADLGNDVFQDPLALESAVVTEITAAQDSWDQYDSVYALRADGRFVEGTKVVVGPSEDLQSCSHVLSLARAANIPIVVIGLGPMSQAWATFVLEPAPEKHTIRFHEADAVVTFDHLSWASIEEADAIRLMTREATEPSAPPADPGPGLDSFDLPPLAVELDDGTSAVAAPGPASEPGWGEPIDGGTSGWPEDAAGDDHVPEPALVTGSPFPRGDGGSASATTGWHRGSGGLDSAPQGGEPGSTAVLDQPSRSDAVGDADGSDPEPMAADEAATAPVAERGDPFVTAGAEVDLLPTLDEPTGDVSLEPSLPAEGGAITAESRGSDDLWASLPSADPGSLAGGDDGGSTDENAGYDWAVGTSDDEIDDIFGRSGMLSLATSDDLETDGDDEELEQRLAAALADTSNLSPGNDLSSVTQALGTRMDEALDEHPPASASPGSSGLRLEVCGPIRLLREGPDGELQAVPMSGTAGGLTAGQLAMFALLGYHSKPSGGGITAEEVATAFWSPFHKDGSLRQVPAGTVKKKVYELRAAVKSLLPVGDVKTVIPEAVDQRYSLAEVSCDWHELKAAIVSAEAGEVGTEDWIQCAESIMALIRPPGLFTVPAGKRAAPMFLWVEEYESIAQDAVRRLGNILVDYAGYVSETGDRREALRILRKAREASAIYTWEVANAFVRTLLLDGDVGGARAECEAYERQLDAGEDQDVPGSPRRMLNDYLGGNASAEDQH